MKSSKTNAERTDLPFLPTCLENSYSEGGTFVITPVDRLDNKRPGLIVIKLAATDIANDAVIPNTVAVLLKQTWIEEKCRQPFCTEVKWNKILS